MNQDRLLELAGVPVTEGVSPDKEFVGEFKMKFKEIEERLTDLLADYIGDGEMPEGSTVELTSEVAQWYVQQFVDELYNNAGHQGWVEAEMELDDKALKEVVKKGK